MTMCFRKIAIALLMVCLVLQSVYAAGRDRAAERQKLREKAAAQAAAAAAAAGGVKVQLNPRMGTVTSSSSNNNVNAINDPDAAISKSDNDSVDYALVIDAGSTGSRGFIVKFSIKDGKRVLTSVKGRKVTPGLSSFPTDKASASSIVEYLLPVIIDASKTIPESKHGTTKVYIKGTAGMRLLSSADQKAIWSSIYEGLKSNKLNPFQIDSKNLGTISGRDEAYYAVLASNYVAGRIDGDLKRVAGTTMVGALDMGGSSTQMIFHMNTREGASVTGRDFWSHSWLNYGVEVVRERVVERLVMTHLLALKTQTAQAKASAVVADDSNESHDDDAGNESKDETAAAETIEASLEVVVTNPCTFVGHEAKWNDSVVLRGTGDAPACLGMIKSTVWPSLDKACKAGTACAIDGIKHPPVRGEFYGMSVYFYAIDAVKTLRRNKKLASSWPNPTISELKEVVSEFCASSVDEASGWGKHPYTRDDQVVHRCLEGLYMTALLEVGFGFDTESRNLTIALDVKGTEVEWTLGFALDKVPLGVPSKPSFLGRLLGEKGVLKTLLKKSEPKQKAAGGDTDGQKLLALRSSNDELLKRNAALGAANEALRDEVARSRETAKQLQQQREAEMQLQQQREADMQLQQQEVVECDCLDAEARLAGKEGEVSRLKEDVFSLKTKVEKMERAAEELETREKKARAELSVAVSQERAASASAINQANVVCRADLADDRARQDEELKSKDEELKSKGEELKSKDEAVATLERELRASMDALSQMSRDEEQREDVEAEVSGDGEAAPER